jgi:hypothetical protein
MTNRLIAGLALVAFAASGCATGTAHRLPIVGAAPADEAAPCELRRRAKLPPKPAPCPPSEVLDESARPCAPEGDRTPYVLCLDQCPGATTTDGDSCPEPPTRGVVCEKTYKPNVAGIVAGTIVGVLVVFAIGFAIGAVATWDAFHLPR